MTKYIVKLTEQEEMALRQLAIQPGFEVIFKLLQGESLDAQTAAMECADPDEKKRLLMLTDAQATAKVVSNLTRKLASYREIIQPSPEEFEDPFQFSVHERKPV
jgi:RNA polymerase-interacting CarD/CdnL/TRCF family regulator